MHFTAIFVQTLLALKLLETLNLEPQKGKKPMLLQTPFRTKISGCGSFLPEKILHNSDLEKMIDTNDQWITERTGIKERHIASEQESLTDMSFEASKQALKEANMQASQIDMIIFATVSGDQIMPSTACLLQKKLEPLGIGKVMAFDLAAACSGFVYALTIADQFIRTGMYKNILVVGGEILSRYVDYKDRSTCILFGDGVGAFVASRAEDNDTNTIIHSNIQADGTLGHLLELPNNRPRTPYDSPESAPLGYVNMNGREIFKNAVRIMSDGVDKVLKESNMAIEDIDWVIPHQANQRIIEAVGKRLGVDESKVVSTVANTANTSAGTIPIAFNTAFRDGRIKRGQNILFTVFGGGFTSGCMIFKF